MTNKIYCLTDYKGYFGSKYTSIPYRSGMDKDLLKKYFKEYNYVLEFINFSDVNFKEGWKDRIVLYTSQEDNQYLYKDFIEDIVYGLELSGAIVIPKYKYLKANNNKIFMEILRDINSNKKIKGIESKYYGSLEELNRQKKNIKYPIVIKTAKGAMSKGVSSAKNEKELLKETKVISRTLNIRYEIKDYLRKFKHKDYKKDSKHRNKFIIQNMIPGLANDYKVLTYGSKIFYLKRMVRSNDFRASGSGNFSFVKECPKGMLEYALDVFEKMNVPNLSLDVCFDGKQFHIIEFQAINFGTTTIEKAPFHGLVKGKNITIVDKKVCLEEVYSESIISFLRKIKR